ncbi:MAG TPA: ferritin-like domain-containing protein [Anaeromyxobacter sp.]
MPSFDASAELGRLYSLEVDAAHAYCNAVAFAGGGPIQTELRLFALEHQRHVLVLLETIVQLGRVAPDAKPDVKGVLIGALTPPRRPLGLEDVITGMRANEQLTNTVYAKALLRPFPRGLRELLEPLAHDERHHLEWMERMVSRRIWETASASHP